MRITLTTEEFNEILKALGNKHYDLQEMLLERKKRYDKSDTPKKITATKNAIEAKINRSKGKVLLGIKELEKRGEKVTPYSIAKEVGVSFTTAKKYLEMI